MLNPESELIDRFSIGAPPTTVVEFIKKAESDVPFHKRTKIKYYYGITMLLAHLIGTTGADPETP